MKTNEIEKAALKLSDRERALLSYKLLESLDAETKEDIDKIWQSEVEERYEQIAKDRAKEKDGGMVLKEAKSKYE